MNRSRSGFALGLLLLLASGCSGDPQPKIAPRESPSASVSESPSGTPNRPVATVREWVVARNIALESGQASRVESLSADDCRTCAGLIDPIKKIYAAGGHFETSGWRVVKAKQRSVSASAAVVDAGLYFAGGVTINMRGGRPNKYPAERHVAVFKLRKKQDAWAINFIGFLS